MQLGVYTALFSRHSLEDVIRKIKPLGIEAVELATGNYGKPAHVSFDLLDSESQLAEFRRRLSDEGLFISALGCGGNLLHPNHSIAEAHSETNRRTILLAEALGVRNVIDFSGCPRDSEGSKYPNFVSVAWPTDYPDVLKWQWETKVIPFWKERARFARDHGVQIAIEMHPGFVVYSPETSVVT